MLRDRKQDVPYQPREPVSNKLLGMLNGLWIELDQYQNLKMKCIDDSIALAQFLERMRIFKFPSRLNSEFDPIRIQILGKEKLSSLSEVCHIV